MVSADILSAIDALQIRYIRSLDYRDWNAWLSCFDDEASYVCTTRENVEQGLGMAFMMDDCRARLRDRVTFICDVWAGTYEDYFTRHFVQRLDCTEIGTDLFSVNSNVTVMYTSAQGASEILMAGCYEDRIAIRPTGVKFVSKRAVADTVTAPRYLVYPI